MKRLNALSEWCLGDEAAFGSLDRSISQTMQCEMPIAIASSEVRFLRECHRYQNRALLCFIDPGVSEHFVTKGRPQYTMVCHSDQPFVPFSAGAQTETYLQVEWMPWLRFSPCLQERRLIDVRPASRQSPRTSCKHMRRHRPEKR
jgi:hypothetical protein